MLSAATVLSSCKNDTPADDGPPVLGDDSAWLGLIPLVKQGEVKVSIVSKYSTSKDVYTAIKRIKDAFKAEGLEIEHKYELGDDDSVEILIGYGIGADGEYLIDEHELGFEGYIIKAVGNKIIIAGGTDKMTAAGVDRFVDDCLPLGKENADPDNLGVSSTLLLEKKSEYAIEAVKIDGKDLGEYVIEVDFSNTKFKAAAENLRNAFYTYAGYWMEIVEDAPANAVKLQFTDGSDGSFNAFVKDSDLYINCAYDMLVMDCIDTLIKDYLIGTEKRTVEFNDGNIFETDISTIGYKSYGGAAGDGVTDDFGAIKATHLRANLTGQTVVAEPGVYYLGQHDTSIDIMTDTVWTDAEFIIDDSSLDPSLKAAVTNVFNIQRSRTPESITISGGLKAGQKNIGITFNEPVMLYIINSSVLQYIRKGNNPNDGSPMQELILVDKDGNVDDTTPIMWDYEKVTSAAVYRISDKPITISGGTFRTIANTAPSQYTYYKRGIGVSRSNTVIRDLVHIIEGEGETGAPYNGFLSASYAANVLFENVTYSGHKRYWLNDEVGGNPMGTYDITANSCINVTWKNCDQLTSLTDAEIWGVMGSNYCKNLTYDGCKLSRFDAHKGTWNATIVDSEIGIHSLTIIGGGVLRVENSVIHDNNIIGLRSDYGSTWQGDIYITNVTLNNTSANPVLITAKWQSHYFGYTCYMPENVYIDGITLKTGTSFRVFTRFYADSATDSVNPYVPPKKVFIRSNPNEYTYSICASGGTFYNNTEVVVVTQDE